MKAWLGITGNLLIVAVCLLVISVACRGSGGSEGSDSSTPDQRSDSQIAEQELARMLYVETCLDDGSFTRPQCACLWDMMLASHSYAELQEADWQLDDGELGRLVQVCLD